MDIKERLTVLTERRQTHVDAHNRARADVEAHDTAIKELNGAIAILQEQAAEEKAAALEGELLE